MNNSTYNFLTLLQRKGINGLCACLGTIGIALNLPWMEIATAIIAALNLFFGIILDCISEAYFQGKAIVTLSDVELKEEDV